MTHEDVWDEKGTVAGANKKLKREFVSAIISTVKMRTRIRNSVTSMLKWRVRHRSGAVHMTIT